MAKIINKTDAKTVILGALAVFLAGLLMYAGRNIAVIRNAARGLNG